MNMPAHGNLWSKHAGFEALKTVFLRASVEVPTPTAPNGRMYAQFDCEELEGMLSVDGCPYAGIDRNHKRVPAPAPGGHALEIEAISVLRAYCQPELRETRAGFDGGSICRGGRRGGSRLL